MTEDETDDTRSQGVEFGDLASDLAEERYPLERDTLLERFGDRELQLADGTVTLGDVLAIAGEETFEDAEAVRSAVIRLIGEDAIGRKGYSDREGYSAGAGRDQDAF